MHILIVTAADTNFFELVQGTILSIRDRPEGKNIAIAFLDLGCTPEELEWLQAHVNIIKQPGWDFDFPGRERSPEYLKGMLARPLLRQYFPNFDVYLWIDADAWVQDWYAIELFIQGAIRKGLAIVPEMHRASIREYGHLNEFWTWKFKRYKSFFGDSVAEKLCTYPMLNAGVFALHKDTPHWEVWANLLDRGLQNCANIMTDQFALNFAIYDCGLFDRTEMLPAWCNWLLTHASPIVDCQKFSLVEPYLPHHPIGIVHIAGGGKGMDKCNQLKLLTISGGKVNVAFRYPTFKRQKEAALTLQAKIQQISLTSNDYVSPNLEVIYPDPCLPHPFVPVEPVNSLYADPRLISRAEAQILYNIALKYEGKQGLAIGCQMGWISCHMAIAGIELDILDPVLQDREVLQTVMDSLNSAKEVFGTIGKVTCVPGDVSTIAELGTNLHRQWSLVCIDGNFHQVNRDNVLSILDAAIACELYLTPDATILFTNCTAPDRDRVFTYLKAKGWQTTIYETLPPMAMAWRGNIKPIEFRPDPSIAASESESQLMQEKHILLCTGDRGVGGVAKYNHALLCALARKGYRVTCLQPKPTDIDAVGERQQLGIRHLWFEDSQTQPELTRIFNTKSERPHAIVSSNTSPFSNLDIQAAAIAFGIPFIIVEGLVAAENIKKETPQRIEQLARHYVQANETIAVSTANLNLLHQLFGLPRDRGRVIYYGRPPEYFRDRDLQRRDRLRHSLNIPNDAVVCFTSARIEMRKGYHYQLEAIQALMATPIWDRLYFVWAGGGIFRPELETQIKEALQQLGIADKVKFLGQVPDVAEWIDVADIFVLPSQDEGMPLSVIEAMAKGLPVIATAVGGIPEALGNTGQLISDPKNDARGTIAELIRAIQELAMQPELRDRLARAAKQRAEQFFSEHRMLEETIAVIQQTLLPHKDYVSTGLQIVQPDLYFPNMIVGDPNLCGWRYLRREIPHNWYVDRRHPICGFLSRDEAHILYNTALRFKGKRALEVGCWMGWSACHLALAGVNLDVIDPLLSQSPNRESVVYSLESVAKAFGTFGEVVLIAGYSPEKVEELAVQKQRKWSLIFIDGNHDAPYPLNDTITCEKYAEADAMILFHDLASPDVTQGLDYLRDRGWKTMIYHTMQIMGVAWRGNVEPVDHIPDPRIAWQIPVHLQHYAVSGSSQSEEIIEFRAILEKVRPYTLLSQERLFSLYSRAKQICQSNLPGNFVECGSFKGGAAAMLATVIKRYSKRPRLLFAFDTFEGMPEPSEVDRHNGIPANDTGFGVGTLKAPIEENLDKVCQLLDVTDIVKPIKGLFAHTLPTYKPEVGNIALLHADGDWYASTIDIFRNLYDIVEPGGIIQIDDYGHWEGCRRAVHDFERTCGQHFDLRQIDCTGVWFQKTYNSKT